MLEVGYGARRSIAVDIVSGVNSDTGRVLSKSFSIPFRRRQLLRSSQPSKDMFWTGAAACPAMSKWRRSAWRTSSKKLLAKARRSACFILQRYGQQNLFRNRKDSTNTTTGTFWCCRVDRERAELRGLLQEERFEREPVP